MTRCPQSAPWSQITVPVGTKRCTRLRRTAGGVRHTQEWVPGDDPDAPDAGEWITWRYVVDPEPTPVVVDDLDCRADALVAGHFPTNMLRT